MILPEIDRQSKLPIYATYQIPEYWIINVEKGDRSLPVSVQISVSFLDIFSGR